MFDRLDIPKSIIAQLRLLVRFTAVVGRVLVGANICLMGTARPALKPRSRREAG